MHGTKNIKSVAFIKQTKKFRYIYIFIYGKRVTHTCYEYNSWFPYNELNLEEVTCNKSKNLKYQEGRTVLALFNSITFLKILRVIYWRVAGFVILSKQHHIAQIRKGKTSDTCQYEQRIKFLSENPKRLGELPNRDFGKFLLKQIVETDDIVWGLD
jgi:hypothetical protein